MSSRIIPTRLTDEELTMLDAICRSKDRGDINRSEMLRLLIRREFTRRTEGTSKIRSADYCSEFRNGRPRRQEPKPMMHSFLMAAAKEECSNTPAADTVTDYRHD